jgi:hypothetical protein
MANTTQVDKRRFQSDYSPDYNPLQSNPIIQRNPDYNPDCNPVISKLRFNASGDQLLADDGNHSTLPSHHGIR